jgi:predicted Zn-dependent protease
VEARRTDGLRAALLVAALLAGCATPSVQDEEELGRQQATQLRQQMLVLHDDVTTSYIDDIGQRLVHAAGPQPFEYTFTVVDDDTMNAQAGFGGQIYVNTGLITRTRNVSELAGVMGHEIGHVVKRHMADNYARAKSAGILHDAAVIGGMIGGVNPGAIDLLGDLATLGILNTFTREAEKEADAFAVDLLPRAGYDPEGIVSMFQTLTASGAGRGGKFFSDHPSSPDRVESTQKLIDAKQLPPTLKKDDNGRLEIIQSRIHLLTGDREKQRRS